MSFGEVRDWIDAYNRNQKIRAEEARDRARIAASIAYRLAGLMNLAFMKPRSMPPLPEAFPGLFCREERNEPGSDAVPDWKRQQAGFAAYAAAYNAVHRKRG